MDESGPPPSGPSSVSDTSNREAAAEHERRARENAQRLEREIVSLRAEHLAGAHRDSRGFFEHERRIHALFKELSPLPAGDRHRLWSALTQAAAEVRRAQQDEWESRRYQSIEARETVEEKLRDAGGLAQGTQGTAGCRKAEALLNEVRALLGSRLPDSPGQILIGPDRRACWDGWRQVRDALKLVRDRQQEDDYHLLAAPVAEVRECARSGDPREAIRRVKELQGRLGLADLRRGQFEDLRKRLSEAWQAAQARNTGLRQERSQHRDEWRARMEGHVARWRRTLEQKRGQREHLLQQVARLEGMEKSAPSEGFTAQVHGWLQETAERLRRTEESITELEERIRTTAKKLGGHGAGTRAGGGGTTPPPASPAEPGDEFRPGGPPDEPPGPPEAGS